MKFLPTIPIRSQKGGRENKENHQLCAIQITVINHQILTNGRQKKYSGTNKENLGVI